MQRIQPCWLNHPTLLSLGFLLQFCGSLARAEELFDVEAIRDPATLEVKVLSDWTVSAKEPGVKQKLLEITVCEWWPGQNVRLPVTLNAPANGDVVRNLVVANQGLGERPTLPAKGQLRLLKEYGIGVVLVGMGTIDMMKPVGELHLGMKRKLLETQNARYSVAWIWGMSQMRALTAAMTEPEVFQPQKVLTTGGSKRGVASTVAGIIDDRFTAIMPVVAPIAGNPGAPVFVEGTEPESILATNEAFLIRADPVHAKAFRDRSKRRGNHRVTLAEAVEAGWSEEDMRRMTDLVWDASRITNFLPDIKERGLVFFWNVGTNDSVSPDLKKAGLAYPDFPLCIIPGGQHGGPATAGFTKRVPILPEVEENFMSFALSHFENARSMPTAPRLNLENSESTVTVIATFPSETEPTKNEVYFSLNRSEPYTLDFEFDDWTSVTMEKTGTGRYEAKFSLPDGANARRIDVVTQHRHLENGLPITFSGPYSSIDLN
ncbi:MAG: PhoPQ-activated protein PqaA family protein [Verrucomicrobiales bacterium]|nr:PhoPQ-activated protein PqaA family protein [Verrucomicrobiales bacterium]